MKLTTLVLILFLVFSISACTDQKDQDKVEITDTFVLATYGTLRTLDPAACYDATGSQRIWNIYEPLVFFDGSKTDAFIPVLTTRVPTLENGGISSGGTIYTFPI
jgi:peptide/nickel transport system substrate-binding protein